MVQVVSSKFFLNFSLPVKPYLEIASYLAAFSKDVTLEAKSQIKAFSSPSGMEIGLFENPFLPALKLTIDRDILGRSVTNTKQYLHDKYAIARFFARVGAAKSKNAESENLFAGLSFTAQAAIDNWIGRCALLVPDTAIPDSLKATTPFVPDDRALLQLAGKVNEHMAKATSGFLIKESGEYPSLADLVLWDVFECGYGAIQTEAFSKLEHFQVWLSHLQQHPVCSTAKQYVQATQDTLPALKQAKIDVANAVAAHCEADRYVIFGALEKPRDASNGDLAIPVPRLRLPGNPVQNCQALATKISADRYIASAKATGPFLNFTLNKKFLMKRVLSQIDDQKSHYGSNGDGLGKTAILDYSSPNIAKPFHAGHLRSTIIGNFTRHILWKNGWRAVGINYLGDWGKQYGLLGVGYAKYGDDSLLASDPIKHLYDVYVKINNDAREDEAIHEEARQYFAKMEAGDEFALKQWRRFRDLSIEKYKDIYERINVEFDVYSGESQFATDMTHIIQQLQDCNLLEESEGAQVVRLEAHKAGTALITKKDGTTLYLTRDIAALLWRKKEYDFDAAYYIVGTQQALHFQQLFKIVELLGHPWARTAQHVNFGMIRSEAGESMSTRKGTVIFLQDIIDYTKDEMHEVMKRNEAKYAQISNPEYVADQVAMSAIIIQDMSARRILNYSFDWARMLSFEGDTGPYLQYAHARLASVNRTADEMGLGNVSAATSDLNLLEEPVAIELAMTLAEWPDIVRDALKVVEPNNVVTYLMKVCHIVASAWDILWVKGQAEDLARARLVLYLCAKEVISSAFHLLGLRPLERM